MKVSELIPIIEGQIDHIVIGTVDKGVIAASDELPYRDSVETFLNRFKDREISYITPMGEMYLEITVR